MNKSVKENIKKNVEMLKESLKLSDKQFEQAELEREIAESRKLAGYKYPWEK